MQHEIMLALGVGLLTVIVPVGVALQLTVQYRVLVLETVINQGKSRRNSHDRVYSNFTLF